MDPISLALEGSLLLLLAAFVAYGLLAVSRSIGGGQFGWLTDFFKIAAGPLLWVSQQIVNLTKYLTHALGSHFQQVEANAVAWIGSIATVSNYVSESIAGIAYDLHDFSRWLVLTEIPKLVHALPNAVSTVVHAITKRVVTVERTVVKLPGLTKAQIRAAVAVAIPGLIAHDLPYFEWLKKHLKLLERAAAGAAAGGLAGVLDWERGVGGRLNRDISGLRARIGKLEKLSVGSLAAGAVAIALAKLGLSWIRCENNKNVGKAICRLPANLLNDVLGLLTDVLVLTNICTVIPLLEEGFELVEAPLSEFVSGAAALVCADKYTASPALSVPTLQLPVSPVGLPALQLP